MLLAEFNHGLGVRGLADRYVPGPGSNRGYAPSVFVGRLILMLQAGGRSLEDLRALRREAGLLRLLDRAVIPDSDTLGDWLQRMGDPQTEHAGLVGLGHVRDTVNARLLRRDGYETYTLDVDATLIEGEKREAHWSYLGVKGYMPLLGFLFETPVCLVDEFREGNVSPGAGQLEFYRQCRTGCPSASGWHGIRADSASYQAALINELETDQVRGHHRGSGRGGQGRDRRPPASGLAGTGAGMWLSGGRGGAHHTGDDGGVSAEHQAHRAAAGRSV